MWTDEERDEIYYADGPWLRDPEDEEDEADDYDEMFFAGLIPDYGYAEYARRFPY